MTLTELRSNECDTPQKSFFYIYRGFARRHHTINSEKRASVVATSSEILVRLRNGEMIEFVSTGYGVRGYRYTFLS